MYKKWPIFLPEHRRGVGRASWEDCPFFVHCEVPDEIHHFSHRGVKSSGPQTANAAQTVEKRFLLKQWALSLSKAGFTRWERLYI